MMKIGSRILCSKRIGTIHGQVRMHDIIEVCTQLESAFDTEIPKTPQNFLKKIMYTQGPKK